MVYEKKKARALALLSGGLDSILAIRILQVQGIKITGLTFVSYFFNSKAAEKAAKGLKIKLKITDFSDEHLGIVKRPCYGYGRAVNPCIDCHLLMLKKAGEIMAKDGYDFVATGEVLGERPMSQNKSALQLIEKESGLKGYLLRPLSAKLLEPTVVEKSGLVDREKLLDISGRSRKRQMELAREWGIRDYPTPAGGCLLTDIQFGGRFKDMAGKWSDFGGNDARLLKFGRHFWEKDDLIVVGRNKEENEEMKKLSFKDDVLIEPKEFPGPTILVRGKNKISEKSLLKAKELMFKYSPKARIK